MKIPIARSILDQLTLIIAKCNYGDKPELVFYFSLWFSKFDSIRSITQFGVCGGWWLVVVVVCKPILVLSLGPKLNNT